MEEWYVNGTHAGTWQTGRNLTYVRVSSAVVKDGFELTSGHLGGWCITHGM